MYPHHLWSKSFALGEIGCFGSSPRLLAANVAALSGEGLLFFLHDDMILWQTNSLLLTIAIYSGFTIAMLNYQSQRVSKSQRYH
jgi:hypothetical protein